MPTTQELRAKRLRTTCGIVLAVAATATWAVPSRSVLAAEATPAAAAAANDAGAALYEVWCAGCHGTSGDGKGLADADLVPPPRDFRRGIFKFRSTSSRGPITLPELMRTITQGLPGSAMPGFGFLSESDREALAKHVLALANLPAIEAGTPVPVPEEPAPTSDLLAAGKKAYETLGCPACHGADGRGDGAAAPFLKDVWGNHTPPPNLRTAVFRGGTSPRDLFVRLAVGLPGTPMPSYLDAADPRQLWALVAYLGSIREPAPTPAADPSSQAKALMEKGHCAACHEVNGKGGHVGPSLDVAARKLDPEWMRRFLADPAHAPKVYAVSPYRMPDLGLSTAEVGSLISYFGALGGHPVPTRSPAAAGKSTATRPQRVTARALYSMKCAACHPLGGAPAPRPNEVGPDLRLAGERMGASRLESYVRDPRAFGDAGHPASGLTDAEVHALTLFILEQATGRH